MRGRQRAGGKGELESISLAVLNWVCLAGLVYLILESYSHRVEKREGALFRL